MIQIRVLLDWVASWMRQAESADVQKQSEEILQITCDTLCRYHVTSNPVVASLCSQAIDSIVDSLHFLPDSVVLPLTDWLVERVTEAANQSRANYLAVRTACLLADSIMQIDSASRALRSSSRNITSWRGCAAS